MEQKQKKLKQSIISDFMLSTDFQKLFSEHWCTLGDIKKDNLEIITKPFKICKISNFLSSEEFMDEIKNELLDVKSRRDSIDLYQFEQTNDLINVDGENLKLLYKTFQTDLSSWMQKNTKIELNNTISMSSSCYYDTDYLLCHDDNLDDRRIAYILYLSKSWTLEDGGTLDLFDTDDNGLPRNVVKSLIPEYNSLVFFEVTDNSYHQVAEITSSNKSRWSINGWFHGPLTQYNRPPRPEIVPNYINPINTEIDLNDWLTKSYLTQNTAKEINKKVEHESFAFMSGFVKVDIYDKLLTEVDSDTIVWEKVGSADIRNYEVADENSLPELLKSFYNLFKSVSMCQLLKNYTELALTPEKDGSGPKIVIELQRWTKGCYTILYDNSTESESEVGDKGEEMQETSSSEKNSEDSDQKPMPSDLDIIMELDRNSPESLMDDLEIEEVNEEHSEEVNEEINAAVNAAHQEEHQEVHQGQHNEEDNMLKMLEEKKEPIDKDARRRKRLSRIDDPSRLERNTDSEESDIGDYLSDSNDRSDPEEEPADSNVANSGSLDVILQFHAERVPLEHTIDYVDPREQDAAMIHIPPRDNHVCLAYKVANTCRFHKYVNHYCKGYFYNLICTYYEQ